MGVRFVHAATQTPGTKMQHPCILCFGFIFTLTLTLGKHMVKQLTMKYGVPLILFTVILQLPITF